MFVKKHTFSHQPLILRSPQNRTELVTIPFRDQANGIFSWGIYWGYGLTFTLGNYLAPADVLGYGWRSAFVIGCAPAVIIALLIFFLEEPRNLQR